MSNKNKNKEKKSNREPDDGNQKIPLRALAVWLAMLAILLTVYQVFTVGQTRYEKINYRPDFVTYVEQKKIISAEIINEGTGSHFIRGELNEIDELTGKPKKFRVDVLMTDQLAEWMQANVPNYRFKAQNSLMRQSLVTMLPFLIIILLLYFFLMRQMRAAGKGAMSFGKSRAKLLTRNKNKITFKDVAGVEEAQEEVEEIVDFLRDPKKFQKLGGRIPKGVMLVGPPGTGKTLLAKAIAGEAEVPFFSISGSDFVEMFVGVGASRVRDMFEQGRKHAPCIIFIDEIDAVGRSRFSGIGGGHDEREQTLNALLVEMDGFETQEGIIIFAATNRPDVLDNALLRPGRFDRQIMVDLPPLAGREDILKIHAKKIKLHANVNMSKVARGTPGFSGADLGNLINEAALSAAGRGAKAVELCDLEEARDKVRFGRERKSRIMDDNEKELTAYHEAGHAIVLAVLEEAEPVHKVTIIPRGQSLGSTMQLPKKDSYTQSKKKLEAMLVGFMGGRAAEELIFNDVTTGASNDLKQATGIARAMVCQFGMNEELGPQAFGTNEEHLFLGREVTKTQAYSEKTAQIIDEEVGELLRNSYTKSMDILKKYKKELDTMALVLLEKETIDGQEVDEIIKFNRVLNIEERREHYPDLAKEYELDQVVVDTDEDAPTEDQDGEAAGGMDASPEASPA